MSRDIEYRVWDKKRKLMFDLEPPKLDTEYGGIFLASKSLSHTNSLRDARDEDLVLLEFTGLKDKHGVKIFEGDILNDGAVVEWFNNLAWDSGGSLHPGFYCRKWADYSSDDITTELSYHCGFNDCEVIGNTYESPELLKEAA